MPDDIPPFDLSTVGSPHNGMHNILDYASHWVDFQAHEEGSYIKHEPEIMQGHLETWIAGFTIAAATFSNNPEAGAFITAAILENTGVPVGDDLQKIIIDLIYSRVSPGEVFGYQQEGEE